MNTKEAIQTSAKISNMVLMTYLSDFEDGDLMKSPGDGCNHIAWQLGHLVVSEKMLLDALYPGKSIELPEGFAGNYDREKEVSSDPADFGTKAEYLELLEKSREASFAALAEITDEQLDEPNPIESMREMIPTKGQMFIMMFTHPLMHAGQFVPIRRALDKPVLI